MGCALQLHNQPVLALKAFKHALEGKAASTKLSANIISMKQDQMFL